MPMSPDLNSSPAAMEERFSPAAMGEQFSVMLQAIETHRLVSHLLARHLFLPIC